MFAKTFAILAFMIGSSAHANQTLSVAVSVKLVPNSQSADVLSLDQISELVRFSNGYFQPCNINLIFEEYSYHDEILNTDYVLAHGTSGVFDYSRNFLKFSTDKLGVVFTPGPFVITTATRLTESRGISSHLGTLNVIPVTHPHVYIFGGKTSSLPHIGSTFTHEIGHLLGLPHVSEPNNVMNSNTVKNWFSNEQCQTMRNNLEALYKSTLR